MKRLLIALAFLFIPSIAWAQCTGVFPANTLCGNLTGSPQPPAAFGSAGTVAGPSSSTSGAIVGWANNLGTQLNSGFVVAPNLIAVGPKSGTSSIATFRSLITSDATIAAGALNAIQMTGATSVLADSGLAMVACGAACTGNYLQLPVLQASGGGAIVFGNFAGGNFTQDGHEFIGCYACQLNVSAGGTTAFVGTDGSNVPVLGNPTGAGGFHMTALGSSVVCESDESLCIGHGASTTVANDVLLGSLVTHITSAGGTDVLIGAQAVDSGTGGNNVGIIAGGTLNFTGTGPGNIIINQGVGCTLGGAITRTVGIGRGVCPTANDHAVIGGSLLTDFYAGTETQPQAAGHFSTIIQTGPQTKTGNYNPLIGDNTITFNCGGVCQVGLGNVAQTGYKLRIRTIAASVSSFASNIVPIGGGAAQTLIVPASAGKWADIEYDGTNWEITAGN